MSEYESHMNQSKTKEYFGIVAENKKLDSREIEVYCQELLPFYEGNNNKLVKEEVDTQVSVKQEKNSYSGQIKLTNTITATYKDDDTNRKDPPDVVLGEQVIIWRYFDSDKYYWKSTGRNDNLRLTEHWRVEVSDAKHVGTPRTDDNTFFIEIDTRHDKRVTIKTSKENDEEYRYLIQIDAKNNNIHLCDDNNNEFYLNSKEKLVRIRNNDGSFVEVNKKDVNIFSMEDTTIKAGRQFVLESPVITVENTNKAGVTSWNSKAISFNARNTFSATAKCIGMNGHVVMPITVVTGRHQAISYSTGPVGKAVK